MQTAEIELKFPIHDLAGLQSRLPGLGFHLDTPRTFEQNTLYDTPSRTLRAVKQILRIRHYGDLWIVTHKRPADPAADGDPARSGDRLSSSDAAGYSAAASYKVRIETETLLDDGPALAAIFHQLGFEPVFRYEKFRTEWSHATPTIDGPLFTDPALPAELPSAVTSSSTKPPSATTQNWRARPHGSTAPWPVSASTPPPASQTATEASSSLGSSAPEAPPKILPSTKSLHPPSSCPDFPNASPQPSRYTL